MADITIRINTDNAAFGEVREDAVEEVARILYRLTDRLLEKPWLLEDEADTIILRDTNGNAVGTFDIEP